jgi:hypothetical protein
MEVNGKHDAYQVIGLSKAGADQVIAEYPETNLAPQSCPCVVSDIAMQRDTYCPFRAQVTRKDNELLLAVSPAVPPPHSITPQLNDAHAGSEYRR